MYRRLSNAIHVHQLRVLVLLPPIPGSQHGWLQNLAAKYHHTQPVSRPGSHILGSHQQPEGTGSLVQHRHILIAEQLIECIRRSAHQIGNHHEPSTMQQRPPNLPDREVECKRVKQGPDIMTIKMEPLLRGRKQSYDILVLDHDPLRQTCRTRGVNHIC